MELTLYVEIHNIISCTATGLAFRSDDSAKPNLVSGCSTGACSSQSEESFDGLTTLNLRISDWGSEF